MDEFEKAIGSKEDNNVVNQRLIGIFLTWMQEKKEKIFVVATVNNISKLPAELLRRGRFDKIYYVDLPDQQERVEILNIHLKKMGWENKIEEGALNRYSARLVKYSGADIEYILREAKRKHICNPQKKIEDCISASIDSTKPVASMLADDIDKMREEFSRRCFENVNGSDIAKQANENENQKEKKNRQK
jgi:SpoVK/Ycf46/Vps4 family AAA+-type ATPase